MRCHGYDDEKYGVKKKDESMFRLMYYTTVVLGYITVRRRGVDVLMLYREESFTRSIDISS
jgi:hypothetical protein